MHYTINGSRHPKNRMTILTDFWLFIFDPKIYPQCIFVFACIFLGEISENFQNKAGERKKEKNASDFVGLCFPKCNRRRRMMDVELRIATNDFKRPSCQMRRKFTSKG